MASQNDKIWYFSYGSNMSPKVMSEVRNVKPTQSLPSVIPGWYLNFDAIFLPYYEPAFASIGKQRMSDDQPVVHGVVHEITCADFDQIKRKELGSAFKNVGYECTPVTVQTYDGQKLSAVTFIEVYTKVYHGRFSPTKRYMEILENGSVESNLEPKYTAWLKTLPRYDAASVQTLRHRLGRFLFLKVLVNLCSLPILGHLWWDKYMPENIAAKPRWIVVLHKRAIYVLGHVYYFLFRPVFGPGAGEEFSLQKTKLT